MYFKDKKGQLHFLSGDDIANGGMQFLPDGCIKITDEDAIFIRSEQEKAESIATRSDQIKSRLAQIDIDSVRPLRAIAAGFSTQYDVDKLASLDEEAAILRAELAGI